GGRCGRQAEGDGEQAAGDGGTHVADTLFGGGGSFAMAGLAIDGYSPHPANDVPNSVRIV
ncbi:MAG: hypothetical protein WCO76_10135, partial [Planctomycetota bacterium]